MKTLIAIPCTEKVDVDFIECLSALEPIGTVNRYMLKGSLLYDNRNRLAQKAIEDGYDYILWLDSDMVFEPNILKKFINDALAHDYDLISGIFFSRKRPYKPCVYQHLAYVMDAESGGMIPTAENYFDYPKDQIFEVEGFGFGAVLTKVDAMKDILEKQGLPFSPRIGFGEDLSFCLKARDAGYKMYCDSRIKVGHIGQIVVNEDLYEEQKNGNN